MSDSLTRAPEAPARGIFSVIFALTLTRTCINMTRRFTYAFVPEIARALGVPVTSVQNAITLQSSTSILSPALGTLSERYGHKYVMAGALLLASLSAFIGALMPVYGVFLAMFAMFGLCKTLFDPAAIAYLGDRIPYHRRGLAIGVSEFGWGGALLIAAPLTGLLLERATLGHVFAMLSLATLIGAGMVMLVLPGDRPKGTITTPPTLRAIARTMRGNPAALGALGYTLLNSAANEMLFINYGAFMEQSFGLALSALGVVTIAISLAEALGEGAVAGIADRLGPKRLALLGAVVAAACYAAFPLFAAGLPVAIGGVFLMFLGYEIAVVAAIPVYTEILPSTRAVMMAAIIGSTAVGRVIGGLSGAALFNSAGITVTALSACGLLVLGIWLLWRNVHITVERNP